MKDILNLATFYGNPNNRRLPYVQQPGDQKEDVDTVMVIMIPLHSPWELHVKISKLIAKTGTPQRPTKLEPCLEWCLKAYQIKMGDMGCNIFPLTPVLTVSPVTIGWTTQQLETIIGEESAPTP